MPKLQFSVRWTLVATGVVILTLVGYLWWKPHEPVPVRLALADGTVVWYRSDTRVTPAPGFPRPREMAVDGEILMKVPAASEPLGVRTRLMQLSVTGPAIIRITAHGNETGDQVEVLTGDVVVTKNYASSYMTPDHLAAGEMSMVNQTIDLMEKEHMGAREEIKLRAMAAKAR